MTVSKPENQSNQIKQGSHSASRGLKKKQKQKQQSLVEKSKTYRLHGPLKNVRLASLPDFSTTFLGYPVASSHSSAVTPFYTSFFENFPFHYKQMTPRGFPGDSDHKDSACRRRKFDPWVGEKGMLPTPVFLPGESYGQRSLSSGGLQFMGSQRVGHD